MAGKSTPCQLRGTCQLHKSPSWKRSLGLTKHWVTVHTADAGRILCCGHGFNFLTLTDTCASLPGITNSKCLNSSLEPLQSQLKLKSYSPLAFHTAYKDMQPECCCLSVRLSRHTNKTELHLAKHCPAWFSMFMQHQAITIVAIHSFYRSAKLLLSCQFRLFPLKLKDL